MRLRHTFALNLRQRRLAAGLSQEALANEAGLDRTYVSALEREIYSVSIDTLEKLAQVLKATPAELLKDEENEASIDTKVSESSPLPRGC